MYLDRLIKHLEDVASKMKLMPMVVDRDFQTSQVKIQVDENLTVTGLSDEKLGLDKTKWKWTL